MRAKASLFLALLMVSGYAGPFNDKEPVSATGIAETVADAPAIYVSASGSDSNNGLTAATPLRTINFGIQRAQVAGISVVKVIQGTYTEAINLVGGIHVIGGYNVMGQYSPSISTVTVNGVNTSLGKNLCLVALEIGTPTYVSDIRMNGSLGSGRDTYVVYVRNSSGLVLQRVIINGANARPGLNGSNGSSASSTRAPSGQNGGNGDELVTPCDDSSRGQGGNGGSFGDQSGGHGGDGGTMDTNCDFLSFDFDARPGLAGSNGSGGQGGFGGATCAVGQSGANGQPGANGSNGASGSSSLTATLIGNFWSEQVGNGNAGSLGTDGRGGGGGGGSGGCDTGTDSYGAGGGGGGAGGSRAPSAGSGGTGGGSAFGVFAVNSSLQLLNCRIESGDGGRGGNGGFGGNGQPGGLGGNGGNNPKGDFGGSGGDGGKGGDSGDGGGGAGGHSIGVYLSGSSLTQQGSTVVLGSAGPGGSNAQGGQSRDAYPSFPSGTVEPLRFEQLLSYPDITTVTSCDEALVFDAQASSGLPVTISTNSPIATITNNNQISFSGSGEVNIDIYQAGNELYEPVSATVALTVMCSKESQSITFEPIGTKMYGDPPIVLMATASSGLPVTFELLSGPAELAGSELTLMGIGEVTVRASQAGNDVFDPAPAVTQSFTVTKANQILTIDAIADQVLGGMPIVPNAVATSGLPVQFAVSGPAVLSMTSLTPIGTGAITVTAFQPGNELYNPAVPVQVLFQVTSDQGSLIPVWYVDVDGDGYGDANTTLASCFEVPGYVQNNDDCDDADPTIHPEGLEIDDDIDNNCDGQIDEGFGQAPLIEDLVVSPVCSNAPLLLRRWEIQNPNDVELAMEWEIDGTIEKSWVIVPPGTSYLTTIAILFNPNRIRIYWHNDHGERMSAESNSTTERCSKSATSSARTSNTESEETSASASALRVYPNPASHYITLEIPSDRETELPLQIISPTGTQVRTKLVQVSVGTNFITEDVTGLANGVYIIKAGYHEFRLVKQ